MSLQTAGSSKSSRVNSSDTSRWMASAQVVSRVSTASSILRLKFWYSTLVYTEISSRTIRSRRPMVAPSCRNFFVIMPPS